MPQHHTAWFHLISGMTRLRPKSSGRTIAIKRRLIPLVQDPQFLDRWSILYSRKLRLRRAPPDQRVELPRGQCPASHAARAHWTTASSRAVEGLDRPISSRARRPEDSAGLSTDGQAPKPTPRRRPRRLPERTAGSIDRQHNTDTPRRAAATTAVGELGASTA